jgi:Domain of Unknown Function with PDB structure (DUF3857)/Transglutaminase-like superfamily
MLAKTHTFRLVIVIAAFVLVSASNARAGNDVPGWLRQAASVTPPAYEKDVPAVVLLDDEHVSLSGDAKLVTEDNYAIKLLTREGRHFAMAEAYYLASTGKVRDIMAWFIRPDGTTKTYDKKTILDRIADTDDVYDEGRIKFIDATDDVDIGYVFGYTIVSEESPLFYQDVWSFQERLPTLVSRYSLSLPSGWSASSITFNSSEIKPQVNGTQYIWEMRDLAPIPPEPMSPAVVNLAPRIAVNYSPNSREKAVDRVFANWADVSRWATSLHDPEVIVDDNIAGKARELTANAQTELEKIRAIGNYVQNLQYISIDIGVGYGNGYRPRASTLVLGRGYGDCKDKANLMRSLLKALKIEAYPIAIFSGDPTFVREQWPSPRQFNHCIIAVKVSDATKGVTILDHEKLGRLLIFDATDPYTPVGDLPDYLQGSLALIIAGDNGGLAKMPITPPETDLLERNIEVNLTALGGITGTIREVANGQASTVFRSEFRRNSATDYRKSIEGWLTNAATGAKLENLQSKDGTNFELDTTFSADRYAQLMQNRLLVFKPVIVGRRHSIYLTEKKRTSPIEIGSSSMNETVSFTLPAGFVVDELPDAVNLETAFGKYSTKYEVKGGTLLFTRKLSMNRIVVPVEKYSTVRDFFSKIRDVEQSPVVLVKK